MRVLQKRDLEENAKISHSFQEFQRNLGYSESYNTRKRLQRLVREYDIDVSHFDKNHSNRLRAYPIGKKICLYCGKDFETSIGRSKEPKYCSQSCANTPNIGNRRSKESNKKISDKLTNPLIEKKCCYCGNAFKVRSYENNFKYCSRKCVSNGIWQSESYRENHSRKTSERIKSGNFGWWARQKLSFPEQVYKRFLEENGFKDKFINNYAVKGDGRYYYLDFYFSEFNLDLEIDGQQHKRSERKEHDIKRDSFLVDKNYKVFRLEWREITTKSGKQFLKEQQNKLLEFLRSYDVNGLNMQS